MRNIVCLSSKEKTAREAYLRHDVEAPNLATVKDFLRFPMPTSRSILTDRPTADFINSEAEWFFRGFT